MSLSGLHRRAARCCGMPADGRGVEGSSDDLDRPLAALFADAAFRTTRRLGSLNSVNIARVVCACCVGCAAHPQLTQAAHFVHAVLQAPSGTQATVFVPSGAGGNITGGRGCMIVLIVGVLASMMGLPVDLCIATNSNDILHR